MTTPADIRPARDYTAEIYHHDTESEATRHTTIPAGTEAEQDAAAMAWARTEAEEWMRECTWDAQGACVEVRVTLEDADSRWPITYVTVEIEPDHWALIRAACGDRGCGLDPEDHDWTADGEGGLKENPGVWSGVGTTMIYATHCRRCGLHRTERQIGAQRNAGEHDTTTYEMADDDQIAEWRRAGAMDEATLED